MFKTSAIFAALLLAGGGAASAAEIGVRNTWGTTTRDITRGASEYVRTVTGQYSEGSAGFGLGIVADDFDISTYSDSQSFSDTFGSVSGSFDGTATGSVALEDARYVPGPGGGINEGANGTVDLVLDGSFSGYSDSFTSTNSFAEEGLEVDGSLSVAGSYYTRYESGDIKERVSESYSFSGNSTTGFSELSTFSR